MRGISKWLNRPATLNDLIASYALMAALTVIAIPIIVSFTIKQREEQIDAEIEEADRRRKILFDRIDARLDLLGAPQND